MAFIFRDVGVNIFENIIVNSVIDNSYFNNFLVYFLDKSLRGKLATLHTQATLHTLLAPQISSSNYILQAANLLSFGISMISFS